MIEVPPSTDQSNGDRFKAFGWRYTSRLQTERTIAVARLVLASASLFAVWLDPAEPARYVQLTHTLHSIYLLYALALAFVIRATRGPSRLPFATHVIDVVIFSVFQYLTLGPSSPFFMYFLFSLFCGALRWGWRGTLATAVAVLLSFLVMGDAMSLGFGATEFELNRFIIRAVYLAVAAGLLVYLGQHEARLRAQIERLAGWPSVGEADLESVVRSILAHAADVVSAPRAVLIWDAGDEPWRYVASWSAAEFAVARHSPDAFEPVVPAALEDSAFVVGGSLGDAAAVVVSRGYVLTEWRGHPAHPGLLPASAGALISAPFRTEGISGRVFMFNLELPTPELLPLTEVIAREIGASLDQFLVTRRLSAIAASEERIQVARDLHDGVLQSLTGLRLELESVAASSGGDLLPATRDRLRNIERAIAMEQRELRLFIAGLQPPPGCLPGEDSLADRLEGVRERLALEWKMPVTVRVSSCPTVLPDRVLRGVPLMVHEAAVNALKHAQPTRVSVDVQGDGDRLRVVIADDGRGFPFIGRYDDAALRGIGESPLSLRSRVRSLGGEMAIESTRSGSRVEIALPLAAGGR